MVFLFQVMTVRVKVTFLLGLFYYPLFVSKISTKNTYFPLHKEHLGLMESCSQNSIKDPHELGKLAFALQPKSEGKGEMLPGVVKFLLPSGTSLLAVEFLLYPYLFASEFGFVMIVFLSQVLFPLPTSAEVLILVASPF